MQRQTTGSTHAKGEQLLLLAFMSPLTERWGHVALSLSALSVFLSHSFLPALSIVQAVKQATLTQCWADVGPLSTRPTQHWPSIELPDHVWRHAECGPASQTAGQH